MRYPKPARFFDESLSYKVAMLAIAVIMLLYGIGFIAGVVVFDPAEFLPLLLPGVLLSTYGVLYILAQQHSLVVKRGEELPDVDFWVTFGFFAAGSVITVLFTLVWLFPAVANAFAKIPIP